MMLYLRMSTPSESARRRPGSSTSTLKPTTIAPEAIANETSFSPIVPVPVCRIFSFTSSLLNLSSLVDDRFDRALHIGLQNDGQLFHFAGLDAAEEIVE